MSVSQEAVNQSHGQKSAAISLGPSHIMLSSQPTRRYRRTVPPGTTAERSPVRRAAFRGRDTQGAHHHQDHAGHQTWGIGALHVEPAREAGG